MLCAVQHFPMYRVSDSVCSGPDAAAPEVRNARLKQRWDCLSKEASDEVRDHWLIAVSLTDCVMTLCQYLHAE